MAELLHYSPEAITTLLTGYTPIQNKKLFLFSIDSEMTYKTPHGFNAL